MGSQRVRRDLVTKQQQLLQNKALYTLISFSSIPLPPDVINYLCVFYSFSGYYIKKKKGIIQHVSFRVWILSLSKFTRLIHVGACVHIPFLFMAR